MPGQIVGDLRELVRTTPRGVVELGSAPLRRENLDRTGLCLAALATAFVADEAVRRNLQRQVGPEDRADAHRFASAFDPKHLRATAAGLYGIGLVFGVQDLRETGREAVQTLLVNEALTIVAKRASGRSRPFRDEGAFAFDPFGGATSLPSGHASNAFALATVLSRRADRRVVSWAAYGLATAVALERIVEDVHWTSDVVASAILGIAVGRTFTRRSRESTGPIVLPASDRLGLVLIWRF